MTMNQKRGRYGHYVILLINVDLLAREHEATAGSLVSSRLEWIGSEMRDWLFLNRGVQDKALTK